MTTKEQDEFVTKWCAALRSGDYKQGRGSLYGGYAGGDPDGYCCLGVAARILGVKDEDMVDGRGYREVEVVAGLNTPLGYYKGGALYNHNDFDGWDFNQIADLIESRPEGLFKC